MGSALHILLVEDDPDCVEFVSWAVQDCARACTIAHVGDGQDALDYLVRSGSFARGRPRDQSGRSCASRIAEPKPTSHEVRFGIKAPDLVLLDLNLPRLNGKDVLREAAKCALAVPFLVLTSFEHDLEDLARDGLFPRGELRKPVNARSLERVLTELFPSTTENG